MGEWVWDWIEQPPLTGRANNNPGEGYKYYIWCDGQGLHRTLFTFPFDARVERVCEKRRIITITAGERTYTRENSFDEKIIQRE